MDNPNVALFLCILAIWALSYLFRWRQEQSGQQPRLVSVVAVRTRPAPTQTVHVRTSVPATQIRPTRPAPVRTVTVSPDTSGTSDIRGFLSGIHVAGHAPHQPSHAETNRAELAKADQSGFHRGFLETYTEVPREVLLLETTDRTAVATEHTAHHPGHVIEVHVVGDSDVDGHDGVYD